jgi:hypothetical protein
MPLYKLSASSCARVRRCVSQLRFGPDEISSRLLKEFATEFGSVLTDIFNKSIKQCEVPKDWKQANVIPVFKKGEKYLASKITDQCH